MRTYKLKKVFNRTHVLCESKERNDRHRKANYLNTGMALCGILRKKETIKKFLERTDFLNK